MFGEFLLRYGRYRYDRSRNKSDKKLFYITQYEWNKYKINL